MQESSNMDALAVHAVGGGEAGWGQLKICEEVGSAAGGGECCWW